MEDEDSKTLKHKKWIILTVVTFTFLVRSYGVACFATVNDVVSAYFHIQPEQTDLLSLIIFLSKSLTCIFIAIFCEKITTRNLMITATTAVSVGNILVATAISSRTSYAVVVLGQSLNGVASACMSVVPALVALEWFGVGDSGVAVSIPWAVSRISLALSGIVSTHTFNLTKTKDKDVLVHTNKSDHSNHTHLHFSNQTMESFERTFQTTFFILSIISIVVCILTNVLIKSPTATSAENDSNISQWTITGQFMFISKLFTQCNFIALTVINLLLLSIKPMVSILLSSLILEKFPELTDRIPGEIFFVASLVGSLGGPVAGYLLDRFKCLKTISITGSIFLVLSCTFVVCSFYTQKIVLLYFSFTFVVFFKEFSFVSITKILMVHVTYSNKLRLTSIFMTAPLISVIGYSYAVRALLDHGYIILASGFPLPFVCTVVFFLSCINTEYEQLEDDTSSG
ncbi:uncharacterized protein LOC144421952 [Styela clava]